MCLPYVNLYLYAIYVNQASLMYDNVITNQHCQVNTDNTGVTTVTADFVIFMKKKTTLSRRLYKSTPFNICVV